ncbi:MAG: tRNA (adenosine(37)-N6)-threonylcarbamoyltransferase complex ATPase subunit type 1 TsaE [Gammaproteobacteria bacterium]
MSVPAVEIELADESATMRLGAIIAQSLGRPLILTLSGDLGAGKTTLTRGFLRHRGYQGAVKSPTFTLVESYSLVDLGVESATDAASPEKICGIHHFDLYRVADPEELDFIGFEEYFDDKFDVIIEWPELGGDRIPLADFHVRLTHLEKRRLAYVDAYTDAAASWLNKQVNRNKFSNL